MAEYREATAKGSRGSYKKLDHMEIHPVKSENGGAIVEHHFGGPATGMHQKMPGISTPPPVERHLFEKENGAELMNHMKKHLSKMGMKFPEGEASGEEHEGPGSEVEQASKPATEDVNA